MSKTPKSAHRVCLISLGCPKNQVDSETALGALAAQGYAVVSDPERADVLLVNTCAFIQSAEEETIQAVLQAARLKNKGRVRHLFVVGCWVAKYGESKLRKLIPEIDGTALPNDTDQWVQTIGQHTGQTARLKTSSGRRPPKRYLLSGPGTAYLKIAEGCSRKCSFCLIPGLRGPLRSRTINAIVDDARSLTRQGVRELVLVAQDLTRFGQDLGQRGGLNALLDRLVKIKDVRWIRVMYANPDGIDAGLIQRLAREPKICKYLDMPVQHAHAPVLRAMRRPGRATDFLRQIRHLRARVPGIVLRTTLLSGFPGETEAAHQALLAFVQRAGFDRLGVFSYSREAGTPAARLAGQVPAATRCRRQRELMAAQSRISRERLARRVGTEVECLVESPAGPGYVLGRTAGDAPEVDGRILLHGRARPGEIVRTRVTGSSEHDLKGVIL